MIADEFLRDRYKPGMPSNELFSQYWWFGEDPFIRGPGSNFDVWAYARQRCNELCHNSDRHAGENGAADF
jgi:hypothetical protein